MPPKTYPKRPLSSPENNTTEQGRNKMPNLTHSPKKMEEKDQEMLSCIRVMIGEQTATLNASIESLKESVEDRFRELEGKIVSVEMENAELKSRNAELIGRVSSLEDEQRNDKTTLSKRLLQVERDARQLNIVASGIDFVTPQQGFEKLNQMIGTVTNDKIRVTGQRAFKSINGRGMVVATCRSMEEKLCILRAKKQFVATVGEETQPVYIDNDMPEQDRLMQGRLREIAREKREQGKDVRVAIGKLKVDGEWLFYNPNKNDVEPHTFRK